MAVVVLLGAAGGVAMASQQSAASEQAVAPASPDRVAVAAAQDAGAGTAVFASNCASCHQAGGTGVPGTFPPLAGNPNVADAAHVEKVVREGLSGPIDVNGETYDGTMPALTQLSDTEVADVVAYVVSLAEGGQTPPDDQPVKPVEAGTVGAGEALFTGSTQFANGGGACSGCHAAGSIGHLGGPGLGPDLTDVADRLGGEVGLSAWLVNPPSPTMTPIFGDRPLTPEEIADLTAFLVDAPSQDPPPGLDWLVLLGLGGLVVLTAAMAITYRGMRQTYSERLKAKSDSGAAARVNRGRT